MPSLEIINLAYYRCDISPTDLQYIHALSLRIAILFASHSDSKLHQSNLALQQLGITQIQAFKKKCPDGSILQIQKLLRVQVQKYLYDLLELIRIDIKLTISQPGQFTKKDYCVLGSFQICLIFDLITIKRGFFQARRMVVFGNDNVKKRKGRMKIYDNYFHYFDLDQLIATPLCQ